MQWGVRPLMVSSVEFAATAVGQQRAASCSPMATMARQILAAAVRFWFRATSSLARAPREAVVPAVVQEGAVGPRRGCCRLLAAADGGAVPGVGGWVGSGGLGRRRRWGRVTDGGRLGVYWRQRLSGSWQRLTGFGFRKSCFRRLPRSRRLCRQRSRRWLTGDRWLAVCRWRRSGLRLTGRRSVWRICILNRNRFWSDRRRKRRCEQSGGASACNAGTYNSGAGRRRFRCGGARCLRCRGLSWRGEGLGLPAWIGNYNGIGGVIDDDRVVDVVVDDIVWRRRNVFWRVDPDRYRNINRNRKNICIHRRWRRGPNHQVNRSAQPGKHPG